MLWGTHIAVPVLGTAAAAWLYHRRHPMWAGLAAMDYVLVAVAAILPDLIDPHVYLSERLLSPTHSLTFIVVMAALWAVMLRRDPWLWIVMTAALACHVALDLISGGVPLWHPFSDISVGGPWVPQRYWIPADVVSGVLVTTIWLLKTRKGHHER